MPNFDLCEQASVFVQSHVRAHVELMWLLSSATPIGWLNRMIQFKEKSLKTVCSLLYAASSPFLYSVNFYLSFRFLTLVSIEFNVFLHAN